MRQYPRLRRFTFVILITSMIALVLWSVQSYVSLDRQLVYAYSTAISIWFLTDVVRQYLFPERTGQPWSRGGKVWGFIALSIVLGYLIGTLVGDWYAGWSTWDLLKFAPKKLAGLIILSVSISALFITFFYQQNRLQIVEKQAIESKLKLLQSQLEPHMLFNTLANLRALIDVDAPRAQAMLDRLIDYLRATLGAARVTTHPLALEFARLDDYLALMQIRMGSRLHYTLDLPEPLKAIICPALLLQPLVENAVIHGLEPSAQGGEVRVTATSMNDQLILSVIDTGLGIDENHIPESGFGLAQLKERLDTLYGKDANVSIKPNSPTGTQVVIGIPLKVLSHEDLHSHHC